MKYLFVVQGEGRGHLTQALSLQSLLERNGHEVVSVMVGCSAKRSIPAFFLHKTENKLLRFRSPNFLPAPKDKRPNLLISLLYNVLLLPVYIESMLTIRRTIRRKKPDVVVNFYELMCGLTYGVFRPKAPMVNIAHQYYFMTSNFRYTGKNRTKFFLLNFYSQLTRLNAARTLALSFREEETEQYESISVVPPLLRSEISALRPQSGNYIHGYMLNDGFVDDLVRWSNAHPDVPLQFFWDRKDAPTSMQMTDNLTLHPLDDKRFLKYMAGAGAYATTGGFESVCEAMYLKKPVLMVPVHIEQECNVMDAAVSGAGVGCSTFDLNVLLSFIPNYIADTDFQRWVQSAESVFVNELTSFEVFEDNVLMTY